MGALLVAGLWAGDAVQAAEPDDSERPGSPAANDDDEAVGWPLTRRQQRQIDLDDRRTPLPGNTEATTRALDAWPDDATAGAEDDAAREALSRANPNPDADKRPLTPEEVRRIQPAPLQRFTPEFKPRRFVYQGDEFALTVARAAELDRIALRLINTGEKLEILAYSDAAKLSTNEAIKLSFKRAMMVRLYLMDQGVNVDQIFLRALPATTESKAAGPADRVDINVTDTEQRDRAAEKR